MMKSLKLDMLVAVLLWPNAINEKCCQQLSERIRETFPQADIKIQPTSGLCSFYAEDGGLLMGYEID